MGDDGEGVDKAYESEDELASRAQSPAKPTRDSYPDKSVNLPSSSDNDGEAASAGRSGDKRGDKVSAAEKMSRLQRSQANAHAAAAVKFHKQGRPEEALAEVSRAIFLQKDEHAYYELRAKIYADLMDLQSAVVNLKKVHQLTKGESACSSVLSSHLNALGASALAARDYPKAVHLLTSALVYDKTNNAAHLHRALALLGQGLKKEALDDLDHYIKVDAPTASVYLLRARTNYELRRMKEAGADVNLGLKLEPTNAHILELQRSIRSSAAGLYASANEQLLADRYDEALRLLSMAIDLDSEDSQYYMRRALALRRLKMFEASAQDLRKCLALAIGPTAGIKTQLAVTLNEHAVQLHQRQQFAEAAALLDEAVLHDAKLVGVYVNRGDCMLMMHQEAEAEQDYVKAWELDESSWDARMRVGRIYERRGVTAYNDGDAAQAMMWFAEAIRAYPNVPDYYAHRATAALRLERYAEAFADLKHVVAADPDNHAAWQKLQLFKSAENPLAGLHVKVPQTLQALRAGGSGGARPAHR